MIKIIDNDKNGWMRKLMKENHYFVGFWLRLIARVEREAYLKVLIGKMSVMPSGSSITKLTINHLVLWSHSAFTEFRFPQPTSFLTPQHWLSHLQHRLFALLHLLYLLFRSRALQLAIRCPLLLFLLKFVRTTVHLLPRAPFDRLLLFFILFLELTRTPLWLLRPRRKAATHIEKWHLTMIKFKL